MYLTDDYTKKEMMADDKRYWLEVDYNGDDDQFALHMCYPAWNDAEEEEYEEDVVILSGDWDEIPDYAVLDKNGEFEELNWYALDDFFEGCLGFYPDYEVG